MISGITGILDIKREDIKTQKILMITDVDLLANSLNYLRIRTKLYLFNSRLVYYLA